MIVLLLFFGCTTQKTVSVISYKTPLANTETINVLGLGQKVPEGAKLLGTVIIDDTGFTSKCTYSDVIKDAQNQARAMGGNYLLITKHKEPNIWSSCHRITCEVYSK